MDLEARDPPKRRMTASSGISTDRMASFSHFHTLSFPGDTANAEQERHHFHMDVCRQDHQGVVVLEKSYMDLEVPHRQRLKAVQEQKAILWDVINKAELNAASQREVRVAWTNLLLKGLPHRIRIKEIHPYASEAIIWDDDAFANKFAELKRGVQKVVDLQKKLLGETP
jgi:hypothetical protein